MSSGTKELSQLATVVAWAAEGHKKGGRSREGPAPGLSKAALTHRLKHEVNVPVILRPDHIQEADDVGMVPKFLRREPGAVCFEG